MLLSSMKKQNFLLFVVVVVAHHLAEKVEMVEDHWALSFSR